MKSIRDFLKGVLENSTFASWLVDVVSKVRAAFTEISFYENYTLENNQCNCVAASISNHNDIENFLNEVFPLLNSNKNQIILRHIYQTTIV